MLGGQGPQSPPQGRYHGRAETANRPTHHTDGATEARRGALAQGLEKQADFPLTPLKPTVCRDGSVMPQATPAPRWGTEEGRHWPAQSFMGEAGAVPQSMGG